MTEQARQKAGLARLRIVRLKQRGFRVHHEYDNANSGESYQPTEQHAFPSHWAMLAHVHKTLSDLKPARRR